MNFKLLPKIDLHLHLDGAIRVSTIAVLGDELGVKLPTYDPRELAKFVQVDRDCRSLTDFLKRFEIFYPILPHAVTQERVAYELCEDCTRDNVIYFETRFAPALACNGKFTMEDAVVAALEGLRRGQRDFGIHCGLILCCYRSITLQQNIDTVKLAQKYRHQGVVGIDLAGDELHYPAAPHAEAFVLAQAGNSDYHPRRGRGEGGEYSRGCLRPRRGPHRSRRGVGAGHGITQTGARPGYSY